MKALIAGGGMVAALYLQWAGIDVEIFECAEDTHAVYSLGLAS